MSNRYYKKFKHQDFGLFGCFKVMSFEKFLNVIPHTNIDPDELRGGYVIRKRYPHLVPSVSNGDFSDFTVEPENVLIRVHHTFSSPTSKMELLRFELLSEAKMLDIPNLNLKEAILEASDRVLYEYENPTHLVRISNRLWMLTNPNNFEIPYVPGKRSGLFVKNKTINIVYSVHKGEPKTFKILGQN